MFPVTHLYFYSLLFPRDTGGAVGAVFPDTTLLSGLKWPQTHKCAVDFFDKTSDGDKKRFVSFLRGFLSHSVDSFGLDYYGDEKYKDFHRGYAYFMAQPIVPDVVRVCRIPAEMGLWKAHNFVEMAIESIVARENPHLKKWILEFGKDVDEIKEISLLLSKYYPLKSDLFFKSIVDFIGFIVPSGDPLELGESYGKVLAIRHGIEDADPVEIARVINSAEGLIKDNYSGFLKECRDLFLERWRGIL